MGFFLGTREQVQNSRDKRAISVRAIEVLLYLAVLVILCMILQSKVLLVLCPLYGCLCLCMHVHTVELQWLENIWNHENIFETGVVQANEC